MAITFAVRGTSTAARYTGGGATAGTFGTISVDADAGAINGSNLNLDQGSISERHLQWPGKNSLPTGKPISILCRLKTGYTGTPATTVSLFQVGGGGIFAGTRKGTISLQHNSGTGNVFVAFFNEAGTAGIATVSIFNAWSPTANTWYDVVLTFTGDTTAGGCILYIDAVNKGTLTSTQSSATTRTQDMTTISLGMVSGLTSTQIKVDEFIIWDTAITPSSVTLDSGAGGSLNGASRSSPVTVSALDATTYTDAGIANIRSTTSYTYAGVVQTGTAAIPTAANVRNGTATDATTGTLVAVTAANTRSGTATDATTGTLIVPNPANVLQGVGTDNTVGTYSATASLQTSIDAISAKVKYIAAAVS